MISSTKELFRFSTVLTLVSALSILLAALPLLLLSPPIYVLIVMIVFVKVLLTFFIMDSSTGFGRFAGRPLGVVLRREYHSLKNDLLIEIPEFSLDGNVMENFSLMMLSPVFFAGFV